jgi:hypothetical protein
MVVPPAGPGQVVLSRLFGAKSRLQEVLHPIPPSIQGLLKILPSPPAIHDSEWGGFPVFTCDEDDLGHPKPGCSAEFGSSNSTLRCSGGKPSMNRGSAYAHIHSVDRSEGPRHDYRAASSRNRYAIHGEEVMSRGERR